MTMRRHFVIIVTVASIAFTGCSDDINCGDRFVYDQARMRCACRASEVELENGSCMQSDGGIIVPPGLDGGPADAAVTHDDAQAPPDSCVEVVYYRDRDMDGFGEASTSQTGCGAIPVGYVENDADCNDTCANCNPDATETCDTLDNDCDMAVDEGESVDCYVDEDRDTFAAQGAHTMSACSCPSGWTETSPTHGATDCNDDPSARGPLFYPGAPELCDRLDNDCSAGPVGPTPEVAEDTDADGHAPIDASCVGGPLPRDDCKDDDHRVHPGQTEEFDEPYCVPVGCGAFQIAGRGWSCDCGGGAVPSSDYDCDGAS